MPHTHRLPTVASPFPTRVSAFRTPVFLAVALLAALPALAGEPAPGTPAATLSRATVPAAGRQEAVVTVAAFGRYAITATSAQGTAVQLLDRMAGPGEVRGVAGEANGRLDAFLDRGEYKLVARSHDKGKGEAKLAVTPFAELSGAKPPLLVELKLVEATLDDLQQRSYWVNVEERRTLVVEAAGRNLADLRVWQDGTWLVDAEPQREVVQPRVGKPLAACRLVVDLEPGLYLLTAYGSAGQPWADDDGSHPFALRAGIPRDGVALRTRRVVGPFGIDRVLVPAAANYVRIELPEARPALLAVGDWDESTPFAAGGETAAVEKSSVPPVAELELDGGAADSWRVVTVTAEAGQPYVLQHFEKRWIYPFTTSGPHWVSSVHSGHPADSVDATALVARTDQDWQHLTPLATDVIELDAAHGWARRCNLLDTLTVYFRVAATGKVDVTTTGVEARVRFEPFMMSPPRNYRAPDARLSPSSWDLDAGFWVLTVEPIKKGIVDVVVKPAGLVGEVAARPVHASIRVPSIHLDTLHSYAAYLNRQPGVAAGFVVRPLPLDLAEPLPLTQRPGEKVEVPFETSGGLLRAEAEDGSLLEVRVDGGGWQKSAAVTSGSHSTEVRVSGTETVVYSLAVTPHALLATTPLPPVPDTLLAGLPDYPVLADGEPQFLDLERDETQTFLVRAAEPGLYRLESTGLLSTAGAVRTRVVPVLDRQESNGVGRNFFVEQYLREGDYQLSVTAQGRSQGHLGMVVEKTPLADGGVLAEGVPARVSLAAGAGVVYRFHLETPGRYHLRSIGANRTFTCRLEDGEGWPLLKPGTPADVTVSEPGDYRLVVLPAPVAARCLTLLEREPAPLRFAGHGPHPLALGREVASTWMEPAASEPRVPDRWDLELTAPADMTIAMTSEMQADVLALAADGNAAKVGTVPANRGFRGRLEAGRYRLEAVCARSNNRVGYTLLATTEQLVPGQRREVTAPGEVPLSVGREGLVELWSFGSSDVRARLRDAAGHEIVAGDDRPDDWNFHLAAPLAPGLYRLRVEPVGSTSAATTVVMEQPEQVDEAALALPTTVRVEASAATRVYPLQMPAGADVVVVAAAAEENVAIAVEAEAGGSWRALASATGRAPRLELPLPPGDRLRLRVWSVDRRGGAIRLQAAALTAPRATEASLARGVTVRPAVGITPPGGVVAVSLDRPGVFRLDSAGEVRASARPGLPATSSPGATVVAAPALFVFVEPPAGGKAPVVRGTRLAVTVGGEGLPVTVPGGTAATCDVTADRGGPIVVFARGVGAQPGVRLVERTAVATARPSGIGWAAGPLTATAVALTARQPTALLWRADGGGEPFDARLELVAFPAPSQQKVGWGSWSGTLSKAVALAADLPSGTKRVKLALDAGTVAAFADGDAVSSVHAGAGEPFVETVSTSAPRLVLLHTRTADDSFAVEILPAGDAAAEVTPSRPFENLETAAGTVRLVVPPPGSTGDEATLHVRGAADGATFLGADGTVLHGADLAIGARGGTLLLAHRPGRLLAWFDRPETLGESLWGLATGLISSSVDVPSVTALSGRAKQLKVSLGGPAMLHLRAATPMATRLLRPEGAPAVEVHTDGTSLDAYLPTGDGELGLRAVGGGELSGTATLTSSTVIATGEGLGPEVLLAPGETRAFSFTVTTPGPVGLGVHASSDVVDCDLLDGRGARLGRGVVQMPTLAAGTYLIALHAPADGAPVRVRPALAGLVKPDTGPPAEVVSCYLDLAKGKAVECGKGALPPGQGTGSGGREIGGEVTETQEVLDEEGGDEGGDS